MTDRRGFIGGLAAALASLAFGRRPDDGPPDRLYPGWELVDIDGILVADDANRLDYRVTVGGLMLADCLRVCPREGWYEVAIHKDPAHDDFDMRGRPSFIYDERGRVTGIGKAIRHGPVEVWKRRGAP